MSSLIKKKKEEKIKQYSIENVYLYKVWSDIFKVEIIENSSKLKIRYKIYCGKGQCRNYE